MGSKEEREEKMITDSEDEDGPPPGWEFVLHPPSQSDPPTPPTPTLPFSPDIYMGMEQLEVQEEDEGPPPGWHIIPPPLNNMENELLDEDEEEGPPPGWSSTPSLKQPTGHENPELQEESQSPGLNSMALPGLEIGNDHQEIEEGPPPGWQSMPPKQQNIEIVKQEILAGTTYSVPSPQPIINSELEGVEKKEVGNHYETDSSDALQPKVLRNSIDPLQPKAEYRQEDTNEGAQPGLNSIPLPQPQPQVTSLMITPLQLPASDKDIKSEQEVEDVEGPPPGWHSVEQDKTKSEHQDIKEGASRGWTPPPKPKTEFEKQDIIEEGPPPGWNLMPPPQRKTGSENQDIKSEGPPRGSHSTSPQPRLVSIKQDTEEEGPQQQLNMGHGQQEIKEGSQQGSNSMPQPQPHLRPPVLPTTPVVSRIGMQSGSRSEMGQMVCGSCRRLLSYPRGAKYVQCSSCQTVNLVLEANQVGQVKCGGCEVLLMYQFGAGAVQCASCRHLTEIGVQNRRPPLSVQQARGRQHRNFNR